MSSNDPSDEAAATLPEKIEETGPSRKLHGKDIGNILAASGPVVKCVLLRHIRLDGKDTKPHPTASVAHAAAEHLKTSDEEGKQHRPVLTELIDEVSVDTTPSNNQIAQVLGGPFTFVGQFPTEGTVVMARRQLDVDAASLAEQSIHTLRELCKEWDIDTSKMVEKTELVQALLNAAPELPVNPHRLQPPLDGLVVQGDLLLLKVAETPEEADEDPEKDIHVMSNDEFFLDYTKEEYITFAARTDVVAPPPPSASDEDEEGGSDNDDEDDEDYVFGEEDAEDNNQMLNIILAEGMKQFREENGRGPDTRELLELRSQLAEKLGVEVASFDQINDMPEGKRHSAPEAHSPSPKKVKFDEAAAAAAESKQDDDEQDDSKKPAPTATGGENGDREAQEST